MPELMGAVVCRSHGFKQRLEAEREQFHKHRDSILHSIFDRRNSQWYVTFI